MNFYNLEEQVKTEISPCYVIEGDDSFLIDKSVEIVKNSCKLELEDINVSYFDFENFNSKKIIDSCFQIPFACEKRVVIVKNLDKINENDKKNITNYLISPNPQCVLLLVDSFNKNIFKDITAQHILCNKPTGAILKSLVDEKLKENGKTISYQAYNLILEYSATNTYQLLGEITKLCCYIGDKNEISEDDVKLLVSKNLDYEVFELTNALSKKDVNKAIIILDDMLKKKESNGVVALIFSNFRRMFYSVVSSLSTSEIASYLKVKEYAIIKNKEIAKNFSPMKLKNICEIITEVDFLIKSGAMSQTNGLYYLIFKINSLS